MFFRRIRWRSALTCLWLSAWPVVAAAADESVPVVAEQAIKAGRYDAATQALEPWLEKHPEDARAWFLIGVAYAHAHRWPLAIDAFRKTSALKPDLAEPHANLAAVYHALGNDAMAIGELGRALMLKPDSSRLERDLAELHLREALRHYRKSLKLAPDERLRQRYARIRRAVEDKAPDVATSALPGTAAVAPPLPEGPRQNGVVSLGEMAEHGASKQENGQTAGNEAERLTEVLDAVENWRAAWSARDLERYFAAYADDFRPPARFASLAAWKHYKRRVIGSKRHIQVDLEQVRVSFSSDDGEAVARFVQHYRADAYRSDDNKVLTLRRTDKGWKIVREEVVE